MFRQVLFYFLYFYVICIVFVFFTVLVVAFVLLRRHYGRARDMQRYRDNNDTCYNHSSPERRGQQRH